MKNIFNKLLNLVLEHHWIIILSFLLTIIIFAPLFVFPYVIKNEYQGININHFGSDAIFYLTRGKEVLDGHGLGNPVLKEGKNAPDVYLSYSDYVLLAPIKLLGLEKKFDIVVIYNFYNFIGTFLLIILIYYLVWQLSGRKLLSVTTALFVIGGYSIVFYKTLFYDDFNFYARVIYPYFSSLVLFSYLNLLVKSLESIELKYKIFSGLTFGLLFYVYFHAWSFVLAFNSALFLIYFFKKDFSGAKKVLLISFIGLALGIFNLIRLFGSLSTEMGKQQAYFMWQSFGRAPIFSKIGFITLILYAIFWYKERTDKNSPFIFALIIAGWVALNQQIITGRMLQYGHYYWYLIVPFSIIISFYLVWQLIKNENFRKYLFSAMIIIVFINTTGGQYKSFFTTLELKKYEQNFRPIIDALKSDKNPGVILATEANGYLLTTYTSHDLFWQSAATFSFTPLQRFKDALFVYLYLNRASRNNFIGYLTKVGDNHASQVDSQKLYRNLFRNLEGYWSGYSYYEYNHRIGSDDQDLNKKRPDIIAGLYKEYNQAVNDEGINSLLKKYGVNYIVWDMNKNPDWDLSAISGLKQIVSNNNIYLYSLVD
jgi:hypothetical protein